MTDSIVIVSAARTPIGGLLGDFSALAAHRARRRRHQGRGRARRHHRRRRRRSADGQLPDGRPGPGAGAPGRARRRPAAVGRRGHAVEDVRLGHAGDDVRARHAAGRAAPSHGRRRHGEHDQRAAPDVRAQGRAATGHDRIYDHMALDGLEDAYEPRPAMGMFAEMRRQVQVHARGAGPVRDRLDQARKQANEDGSFDWEIAPVTVPGKARRDRDQVRRAAVQGQARQDPGPEAGVQEGRHDHRRRPRRASPTAPPRWC